MQERIEKDESMKVRPDFVVTRSKDLMIRGKSFYAIWDEGTGLWSTDEYDVQRLVDEETAGYKKSRESSYDHPVNISRMGSFSSNLWKEFRQYVNSLSDSYTQLDEIIAFANTEVKKSDYVSRRLNYPLVSGDISAYDEIIGTLYSPEERAKIEWAIGAIISGDAKNLQKFLVLYGKGGTGKSTILNIVQKLFDGYYTTFEAKSLTSNGNSFATEVFKSNPLIAIQHDGDLSKIEDNTKLNSIVSHEEMVINEKNKPLYTARINAFLFMGTNKPVKITDGKSGIIRRLIDVKPTGDLIAPERYRVLYSQVDFELGAIAQYCLDVYRKMGKDYYASYRPVDMMMQTDVFFNFIEDSYDVFKEQDGVSLNQAYEMYKQFAEHSLIEYKLAKFKFREELKNYFTSFEERAVVDGQRLRSWYSGFDLSGYAVKEDPKAMASLTMDETSSIFDEMCKDSPAQYAGSNETPSKFWDDSIRTMTDPKDGVRKDMSPPKNLIVDSVLSDLDTNKLHYVKPPVNHIVIDFDLTDDEGNKSAELNIEAASKWPPTYAEYSKGGGGVHLHYIYDGDPTELSRVYGDGIEIKVFNGNSSLRRRLSKCNNLPVSHIASGLPLKEKKVISNETMKSEKSLRTMIVRNLRKEFHPGTKPSIDFIAKILDDAYKAGMVYDISDMRTAIIAFANGSSNQALYCLKVAATLKYKSEKTSEDVQSEEPKSEVQTLADDRLVIFDVETFPNLFLINWKFRGAPTMNRMINPKPHEVEALFKLKLVGFNNRLYDNHMLYGASMGFNNQQLFELSGRIINRVPGAMFGEAYNLSYADIHDFASKKQSLKKWEFEIGFPHKELGLPWDQPVPEHLWPKVAEYCDNDVLATEALLENRWQDYVAREILSSLSGLPINATTAKHTARIVFGNNRNPQSDFVYTDLSEEFPGYKYEFGKSTYRDEEVGEGGYVYSEPGIHHNVALLDVASMHPNSMNNLQVFGDYTPNYYQLVQARVAIKHGDYDLAGSMLDGKLKPYLGDKKDAEALSYALKIVINIVYGLTAAKFDNPFRDPRNKDNIVAKRGALFMVDLKNFVQDKGYQVVHIKTDSIKIANADSNIIDLVMEFGRDYGYDFEHEATYEKMALVNDAVYAAKVAPGRKPGYWTATGTQFIQPYVFKKLFSHEKIEFEDLCKTFQVQTALYLDFQAEKDEAMALEENTPHFVGKVGRFTPVLPGTGGAILLRKTADGYAAATGSKGYLWMESHMVETMDKEATIDRAYFDKLVDDAVANIGNFGDAEAFLAD